MVQNVENCITQVFYFCITINPFMCVVTQWLSILKPCTLLITACSMASDKSFSLIFPSQTSQIFLQLFNGVAHISLITNHGTAMIGY